MKVAIVGAGFCGLAVAWNLLSRKPSFTDLQVHLFDSKGIGQGASGIAAGLLHPFSGAHAKLNWKGKEGFHATQELLEISSIALKNSICAPHQGILRLAIKEEQIVDFQYCAERYPQDVEWLSSQSCQKLVPGCASAPGLLIKNGLTVYSSLYLQGLWKACSQLGAQFQQRSVHSLEEMKPYDLTIITTGAETLYFPELSTLALTLVKGQVLELAWPTTVPPLHYPLNSHVYLLMTEKQNSCLAGSTYEKGFSHAMVDKKIAQQEIMPKIVELFPPLKDAKILNCYAGMRAVTPNHRPIILRPSASQWVLTGMGSKGLLYHALFAKELVDAICQERIK